MCHADEQWTEALPIVLVFRASFTEDLQVSAADLAYGNPCAFVELLTPTTDNAEPPHLTTSYDDI
jgi:hypothetical protein